MRFSADLIAADYAFRAKIQIEHFGKKSIDRFLAKNQYIQNSKSGSSKVITET